MPYLCTPSSNRTPPGLRDGSRRQTIASGSMSSVIPSTRWARVVWIRTSDGSPIAPASSSALAFTMGG